MNMGLLPPLALIAGPTASGKSALALALAERTGGVVINADSAQVYRDLRIVTARPSAEEEARAPHRLYGTRDGAEACSAADWAGDAKRAIAEAHAAGRLPILVGGTGLYIRTLLDGIAPVPPIDLAFAPQCAPCRSRKRIRRSARTIRRRPRGSSPPTRPG
jgi:tRNA dimethylallyltransferase